MVKKLLNMGVVGVLVLGLMAGSAWAGEVDLLVQKLVEKGILTAGEGQELITQTKEEIKAQRAAAKDETLPTWLQTTKIKGDFRLRHETAMNKGQVNENRERIRVRLGVETKPNDQTLVGIGIATGNTDPRSTNITLGQGTDNNAPGSFKNLTLDYAFGQYTPVNWLTLTGGKFKNPLWQPNDLIWDTDVNPEGAVVQMNKKLSPKLSVFTNNMAFILSDTRTAKVSEAVMFASQPGFEYAFTDNMKLKGAAAYYSFSNVKDKAKFSKWATNTLTGSNYKYNYNSINPSAELSFKEPLGGLVPYFAVFGDYVQNLSKGVEKKSGFDYGIKFGYEKVSDWAQWQGKLSYDKLGRDAFLDIFPDSDRYSGKTNMQSYEAILEYGLGKNSSLGLDYYYSQDLADNATGGHLPEQVVQVDWNLKF
jgi:polyhydroxyalkanoate synthesis regulator phasin